MCCWPLGERSPSRRQAICPMHAHRRVMSITGGGAEYLSWHRATGPARHAPRRARPVLLPCTGGGLRAGRRGAPRDPAASGRRSRGRWSRPTSTSPSTTARATSPGAGRSSPTRSTPSASTSPIARRSTPAPRPAGFTDVLLQRGAEHVVARRRRLRRARLGAAQRRPRHRPRAHERPRAEPVRPALRARSARRRPLLHLAAQGAARAPGLHGAAVRRAGDGQAAVRGGEGRVGRRRRGPRAGRPALRRSSPSARAAQELGASVLGFASSGLPGPKGNRETFAWLAEGGREGAVEDVEAAAAEVEPS